MPARSFTVAIGVLLALLAGPVPVTGQPSSPTCADFDAYEWAQSVYDDDPAANSALDPDGDGIACPALPNGAAPALWTEGVPEAAEPADLVRVVDGDTIEVELDGRVEDVRLILIDTPETKDPRKPVQCFGAEATAFTTLLLSFADKLYLETDISDRDRFDRLLRYVWLEIDGEPYLLNEALVRSGFAALSTYPPDVRYEAEIREAQTFAREYDLGLWSGCGGPGVALTDLQAPPLGDVAPEPALQLPEPDAAIVEPAPPPAAATTCDPSYPSVCIPPYPPDLDCGEIGFRGFAVVPPDPHGFDGNSDGVGCER